jgi:hypothetical protein
LLLISLAKQFVVSNNISHAGGYTQQSSLSEPSWGSEHGRAQEEDYSAHNLFSTPPPDPTQEDTQYREDGSFIPPRNVGAPDRYGWSTPRPPKERPARRRG